MLCFVDVTKAVTASNSDQGSSDDGESFQDQVLVTNTININIFTKMLNSRAQKEMKTSFTIVWMICFDMFL